MADLVRDCPGCGSLTRFETPECADHGDACPELACVLCGWALVLVVDPPTAPSRRTA